MVSNSHFNALGPKAEKYIIEKKKKSAEIKYIIDDNNSPKDWGN